MTNTVSHTTTQHRRSWPATVGRIPIIDIEPVVSGGARPARAVPGEAVPVRATVFREGHDLVGANVVLYDPLGRPGPWTPMRPVGIGLDRFEAEITPTAEGDWTFRVEGWGDAIATWLHAAHAKVDAGSDDSDRTLREGAELIRRAIAGLPNGSPADSQLAAAARVLDDTSTRPAVRLERALTADVLETLRRYPVREMVTRSEPMPLRVDRKRALFGSWYEFFPRSEGAQLGTGDPAGGREPRSGTFATAARALPRVAAMGFDVVYLPPVHPIGVSHRKGRNNTLLPQPGDVGSPWAIGGPLADGTMGGHDAIHPDLGTIDDFDAFVARARSLGLEVALDFALQCSPDHPWVSEHPEWFRHRIDGSVAYAENPPKKYQDIYPIYFDADPEGLYTECLRVLRYWMDHGVRIFRVDNPHTKPVWFWERLLDEIATTDPDVIFLAEAFTRPAMLQTLARVGFHQSYTYFTWRNSKQELTEYTSELAHGPASAFLRPNLFVNTPDILHEYLQHGGREAFCIRAVLAATLSPTWGVYSGFELCENAPVRPGSEEYLNSEKYELRPRDWARAESEGRSIGPLLTLLNETRRTHPALQHLRNLRFHHSDDDAVLCYSKRAPRAGSQGGGDDVVLVVVNVDPNNTRETTVRLDVSALFPQSPDRATFEVYDVLTRATYHWGRDNYVRLDPYSNIAHLFVLRETAP